MLRHTIAGVALVDSAASFTVGLAIPGVASIGVNILGELADEVWSMAPSELADKNRQRFMKAGFSDSNIDVIIDNIWYTPTCTTSAQAAITFQHSGWIVEQNAMSDLVDRLELR